MARFEGYRCRPRADQDPAHRQWLAEPSDSEHRGGAGSSITAVPTSAGRNSADRCPGVLAVHEAADGGLARVRLPGGVLSTAQLGVLSAAAVELGDGNLELTSRANIQIRALRPGAPRELSDRLYSAGLLPSLTHERVRNILASPMSGLDQDSVYDVLPTVAELDHQLCARPELAELPGRFLFALDDGRGDVVSSGADVAVRAAPGSQAELVLAGLSTGVLVAQGEAVEVMLAAAAAFLAERSAQGSEAWRLVELAAGPARVLERLALNGAGLAPVAEVEAGLAAGRHPQVGGHTALVVTVPLGSLNPDQVEALRDAAAAGDLRVTPWRQVVLRGLAAADAAQMADAVEGAEAVEAVVGRLEAVGLVLTAESAWNGMTACAGRPGCAKALADVRSDARRVVPLLPAARRSTPLLGPASRAVHWSGCERRCGRPAGEFVDVVAVGNGYSVDGARVLTDRVGEVVSAARSDNDVMGMP